VDLVNSMAGDLEAAQARIDCLVVPCTTKRRGAQFVLLTAWRHGRVKVPNPVSNHQR
jgi:hypothetical protein